MAMNVNLGRMDGLWRIFLVGNGAGVSGGQEDAFAEEGEGSAAVHLSFEEFGAGVESFDLAGVPGQGERAGDGLVVLADAGGEGGQAGLAGVGLDGGQPGVEVAGAAAAGEDLGEGGDVAGQGVEFGAAAAQGGQPGFVAGGGAGGGGASGAASRNMPAYRQVVM